MHPYDSLYAGPWQELLPAAEFQARVVEQNSIKISLFFLNNGYYPRMSFTYKPRTGKDPRQKEEFKQAESIARYIEAALEEAKKNIKAVQESIIV